MSRRPTSPSPSSASSSDDVPQDMPLPAESPREELRSSIETPASADPPRATTRPYISPNGIEHWSGPYPPGPCPPLDRAHGEDDVAGAAAPSGDDFSQPAAPYWVPAGVDLADLSPQLRSALADIINPTYRELVLDAKPGLHQSTGLSVVHLLWMEILGHSELAESKPDGPLDLANPFKERRDQVIARHLRLVGAKLKASELLLRIDDFKARWKSAAEHAAAGYADEPLYGPPRRSRPRRGNRDYC